jgi:hypothetical protein
MAADNRPRPMTDLRAIRSEPANLRNAGVPIPNASRESSRIRVEGQSIPDPAICSLDLLGALSSRVSVPIRVHPCDPWLNGLVGSLALVAPTWIETHP